MNAALLAAQQLFLQKGDSVTMQIAENETILTTRTGYTYGDGYHATVNGQKIKARTVEDLIQNIIETAHAKEVQLIPHSTSCNEVNGYLLLLKINK